MTARTHILGVFALLLAACDQPRLLAPRDTPDPGDSRIAWHIPEYPGKGTPGVYGDLVYFSARDHSVVAVDRNSGEIKWVTKLPVELPEYYGTGLVVAGNTIVVGDLDVFGPNPNDGEILWRFAPEGVDKPGLILPAAAGENVIVTSSSGHLFSLVARTGETKWSTRVGESDDLRIFHPIVRGNDVFISFTEDLVIGAQNGGVARVSLDDGSIKWSRYLPPPSDSLRQSLTIEPALSGNVLVAGSRDGPTFGFRISDGDLVWTLPIAPELLNATGPPNQELAPLASDDDLIFVGSSMGRIRAVDPATGNVVWDARRMLVVQDGWSPTLPI